MRALSESLIFLVELRALSDRFVLIRTPIEHAGKQVDQRGARLAPAAKNALLFDVLFNLDLLLIQNGVDLLEAAL